MNDKVKIIDEVILSKIHIIRNQKVMLDRDLVKLNRLANLLYPIF